MDDQQQSQPTPPSGSNSFDLNHPTIIGLLYIGSYFTGVTAIIGIVLAYVWRNEPHEAWQDSHYQYLIRTFWISLLGVIVGIVLSVILIGFLVLLAVAVQFVIRSVFSIINAQKQQPMPDPQTWLA